MPKIIQLVAIGGSLYGLDSEGQVCHAVRETAPTMTWTLMKMKFVEE